MKEYLDKIEATKQEVYKIPAFEYLSPFEQDWFLLDEDFNVVMKSDYDINVHGGYAGVFGYGEEQNRYFRASSPAYQMSDQDLKVNLVDMDGEVPVHRQIEEIKYQEFEVDGDNTDLHYFVQVDSISIGEAQEELAASPLGIYQFQYGEHKETGKVLQPTHHSGSFLPLPAHGLISIEWAEYFKGEAPIDAIRVKVADISGYTEEAAEKIRKVAADIEAMGFHVDIIAGSSHQKLEVDVEGIGTVIMPWTTLGAAESIIDSWNIFSFIIALCFAFIAILSLLARFRTLSKEYYEERERLAMIGWSEKTVQQFYRIQWLVQVARSGILSGLILLILNGFDFILLIGFFLSLLVIYLLKIVVDILDKKRKGKDTAFQPSHSLILSNIRFYKEHIMAVGLQLIFGTAAISFVSIASQITTEKITRTNLGEYIHFQINQQQLLLLAGIVLLTLLTLIESIYRLWETRKDQLQFLTVVGSQNREIRRSFTKENLSWVGFVLLFGVMLGMGFVLLFFDFTVKIVLLTLGLAFFLFLLVSIVLELAIRYFLNKGMKGENPWI